MRAYVEPILTATWLFPFVAILITLPYMLFQYWRYGSILLLRTTILFSFILYLMCAYFLTMLPLPTREEVAALTTPYLQLEPFKDVVVWLQKSGAVLAQPATWPRLLNRDLFVMLANIVMTIPFGVYLRYYFRCSWKKTLLLTLTLSLIFELTQLSALFGYYSRPYRLCETDDLITNTLGGMVGYWLAGPLMRWLPSRERMDTVAYRRGTHVSVTRRVTAAIVDWFILGFLLIVLLILVAPLRQFLMDNATATVWLAVFGLLYIIGVFLYFMVGEWLQHGRTFGKRLTHLRLTDDRNGTPPKFWQCMLRYSLLYYGFIPLPFVALVLFALAVGRGEVDWPLLMLCIALMIVYGVCLILVVIGVLNRSNQLPHGALSKTRNISTLSIPSEGMQPSDAPAAIPTDAPSHIDMPQNR